MLKGQDIVVLLALIRRDRPTTRELAERLSWDHAGVFRSLRRLRTARLYSERSGPSLAASEEFLLHGARYVFPAGPGEPARGVPTAWAAEPLVSLLAPTDEPPPVWPDPLGVVRGIAFEPLHSIAVEAAASDPTLARRLALVDAIRGSAGPRVRNLAADGLRKELQS